MKKVVARSASRRKGGTDGFWAAAASKRHQNFVEIRCLLGLHQSKSFVGDHKQDPTEELSQHSSTDQSDHCPEYFRKVFRSRYSVIVNSTHLRLHGEGTVGEREYKSIPHHPSPLFLFYGTQTNFSSLIMGIKRDHHPFSPYLLINELPASGIGIQQRFGGAVASLQRNSPSERSGKPKTAHEEAKRLCWALPGQTRTYSTPQLVLRGWGSGQADVIWFDSFIFSNPFSWVYQPNPIATELILDDAPPMSWLARTQHSETTVYFENPSFGQLKCIIIRTAQINMGSYEPASQPSYNSRTSCSDELFQATVAQLFGFISRIILVCRLRTVAELYSSLGEKHPVIALFRYYRWWQYS